MQGWGWAYSRDPVPTVALTLPSQARPFPSWESGAPHVEENREPHDYKGCSLFFSILENTDTPWEESWGSSFKGMEVKMTPNISWTKIIPE